MLKALNTEAPGRVATQVSVAASSFNPVGAESSRRVSPADRLQHTHRGRRLVEHVKVDARHAGGRSVRAPGAMACSTPISNCAASSSPAAFSFSKNASGNRAPHICVIRRTCAKFVTGKMPGTIGTLDAQHFAAARENEEIGVVVEQLRNHDIAAGFHFALQILQIASGLGASWCVSG